MTAGYYHLHVHPISRQKGHHIHAAVAYRRGTRTTMEAAAAYRHAQKHGNGAAAFDYRGKVGVTWFGIIAPDDVPDWMRDPHQLWQAVDALETRTNARLAQEVVIGLPHQVGLDEHIAMLTAFAKRTAVDPLRLIADIAIHAPPTHTGSDPRHWHAHILLTDRPALADGFARTKSRHTSSKAFVDELRQAWTETHNAHMEARGLPHRIDHRTLEQQRQDALTRGDTAAALDLDRLPQIRLGKARHATHPDYEAYAARRERNHAILKTNKDRAARHKDTIEAAIAKADTAAYLEARKNTEILTTMEPPSASLADLKADYGRPRTPTFAGRLKDAALAGEATRKALALQQAHSWPWLPSGHRADAPSLLDILLPMVATTGPGHPVFTVTAKDILFAFYGMGMVSRHELQNSLERIALEEEHRFAERRFNKNRPKPPPRPKPPRLPTPEADRLKQLQRAATVPRTIYAKRLETLRAFEQRIRTVRVNHRGSQRKRTATSTGQH